MIEVNDAYLEAAANKSRTIGARLYLPNTGEYITQDNIWTGSIDDVIDGNGILSCGNAGSSKLNARFHSLANAKSMVWRGAEIRAELSLKVDGEYVYVPRGTFWITDMKTSNDHRTVEIIAYNRMYQLSRVPYETKLVAPFHYRDLLDEFLDNTGMTLSEESKALLPDRGDATYIIKSWPSLELSYSDVAGHLAGMLLCNARVSVTDPDVLEFVWYEATGTIIKETLYQDGLEKLADSELYIDVLVTGENLDIIVENTDDQPDGEIDFSEFDIPAEEDLPMFTFTYNDDDLTASVELTSGYEDYDGVIQIPSHVTRNGSTYTVTSIPAYGFYGCMASKIQLSDQMENIGRNAFDSCGNITEFTIPTSVTSLGYSVLANCERLTVIYLNAKNCTYASTGSFGLLANETTIIVGTTVTSIQANCFRSAGNVVSVDLPDSITSIENASFFQCGIRSIVIPNSVTRINQYNAFGGCPNLKMIQIGTSSDCAISFIYFNSFSSDAIESITIYKTADSIANAPWSASNAQIEWVG